MVFWCLHTRVVDYCRSNSRGVIPANEATMVLTSSSRRGSSAIAMVASFAGVTLLLVLVVVVLV